MTTNQQMAMNPVQLGLFAQQVAALCQEMGSVLQGSAVSPNIRDRLDFSCALFDRHGGLVGQAAHIPVHLGSMAYAMHDLVASHHWQDGDMMILNDPFRGGTHLPDITVLAPLFVAGDCQAFVASRAHYADIGASTPGSLPWTGDAAEEGILIAPSLLYRHHEPEQLCWQGLLDRVRHPSLFQADLLAQVAANRHGMQRFQHWLQQHSVAFWHNGVQHLNAYAERLCRQRIQSISPACYRAEDWLEDPASEQGLRLCLALTIDAEGGVQADFSGTDVQMRHGNLNTPPAVVAAAVFYVLRCLMPAELPTCAGAMRPMRLMIPRGSLLNPRPPAAVAAGNVETSSRLVDLVLRALSQALPEQIPAASQGSMNNVVMGGQHADGRSWDYYETLAGGSGAHIRGPGQHCVHSHMTNTLNTPIEVLERQYPLQVFCYERRRGSGGAGQHHGGDGLRRGYRFLDAAQLTLLTERRRFQPWGLQGGGAGDLGMNRLNGRLLPSKFQGEVKAGDELLLETPGGGGWGREQ